MIKDPPTVQKKSKNVNLSKIKIRGSTIALSKFNKSQFRDH